MAGGFPDVKLPIEAFALTFNICAILIASASIVYVVCRLAERITTHMLMLLLLNTLALLVQCARYITTYYVPDNWAVIVLDFLANIASLIFLLTDVNLLSTFVMTGHLSQKVVNALRILVVVAHFSLATPLYLHYTYFGRGETGSEWAGQWYRYGVAPWFVFLVLYDFIQSIWITHTMWLHLKQSQRLLLNRFQLNVDTQNNSDATAVQKESDIEQGTHHNDDAPDPHLILRRRYYYSIVCIAFFFAIDIIAVYLFALTSFMDGKVGSDTWRLSIAYGQIAIVNFSIRFVGATMHFENLKSMMEARKKIVVSSNSGQNKGQK